MDFTKFDSRAAAAEGRDLHLRHPVTGDLIYNDAPKNKEPCIVVVIGTESQAAQDAMRAVNKAKAKAAKDEDSGEMTFGDLHKQLVAVTKPLIVGFKNVLKGDVQMTVDDADYFLNLQMPNGQNGELSFVEQVAAFATKRANYLGNV